MSSVPGLLRGWWQRGLAVASRATAAFEAHARTAVVVLVVAHGAIAWFLNGGVGRSGDDFDRYWEIAGLAPAGPSPAAAIEVAPLAAGFFKGAARATGAREPFRRLVMWTMVAADAVIVAALAWAFGWSAAAVYLAITVPLLQLYYMRMDLLPTAAAALAAAAVRRGRPEATALSLVVGIGLKLFPLPLVAWLARWWGRASRRRAILVFCAAMGLLGMAWMGSGGSSGVGHVVTFRQATGWQVESLVGGLLAVSGALGSLRLESDAWRLGTMSPTLSVVLLAMGTATGSVLVWFAAASRTHIGPGWIAGITSVMLFAPILSPQYIVWLAPATGIAWAEGHRRLAALAAGAVPLTSVLMLGYGALLAQRSLAAWPIVFRNGVLLLALIAAARGAWRVWRGSRGMDSSPASRSARDDHAADSVPIA